MAGRDPALPGRGAQSGGNSVNTIADLLSPIGCVDPNDSSLATSGVIENDVNSSFWSDGANKKRWYSIADGTTIDVDIDGDWLFPIGTILMKRTKLMKQFPLGAGKLGFAVRTELLAANACNVAPNSIDLGIPNARIVAPGNAAGSVLVIRMSGRDVHGMPPLGSSVVDVSGVNLLSAWIASLVSCP